MGDTMATQESDKFKEAYQIQMRSTISWQKRGLRVFCRTLVTDSYSGLVLAASDTAKASRSSRALPPPQRLAIRTGVLFDLLETEQPPEPLRKFLSHLSAPEGGVIHLPPEYLSAREKTMMNADSRGGVCVPRGSEAHELLVVGFVFLRALIANLFGTWTKSLALDGSPGATRGKQNLEAICALMLCAMQK